MKKSFNFTHLAVILFGYFVFNAIVNFGKRIIFNRASALPTQPEIPLQPENQIGFKTVDEPETEVIIEKHKEANETIEPATPDGESQES